MAPATNRLMPSPGASRTPSFEPQVGGQADQTAVSLRVEMDELGEGADLRGGAVVDRGSVEPGEQRVAASQRGRVEGVDRDGCRRRPVEVLVRDETLEAGDAQACRERPEPVTLGGREDRPGRDRPSPPRRARRGAPSCGVSGAASPSGSAPVPEAWAGRHACCGLGARLVAVRDELAHPA